MVERNLSEAALDDLPRQLGKREFLEEEIESSNFDVLNVAKRRSNEISSFEGINENREDDLSEFGCGPGFKIKSLVDVVTDCDNGGCLRGRKSVDGIMVLNLGVEADVSLSGNDVVDSHGNIGYCGDGSSPDNDKTANQDDECPYLTDPEGANCCSKPDLLRENEILAIAEIVSENSSGGGGEVSVGTSEKCKGKDDISLMDLDGANAFESVQIKAEFGDSLGAGTSRKVSESGGNCHHIGRYFDVDESKPSAECSLRDIIAFQTDGGYYNANDVIFSKCGPFTCTSPPESQRYTLSCECALSERTDSIKACSCSFCTKAAYIWLDLNYQDIKARASAIRKIQKEASILSERSDVIWKQDTESSSRTSKHESELMHQWRPLFESMANVWEKEGNQLEARLHTLTGLRENCKTGLELINGPTSEKH